MASNIEDTWKLNPEALKNYKKHVRNRVQNDLQDSVEHLSAHFNQLRLSKEKLIVAKKQVESSILESRNQVQESCVLAIEQFTKCIRRRETELLAQLDQIETQCFSPILQCETVLNEALNDTKRQLDAGLTLIEGDSSCNAEAKSFLTKDQVTKFKQDAYFNTSLPSVPELHEVAQVTVSLPELNVYDMVAKWGCISRCGPVQLVNVEEHPGALFLQWQEVTNINPEEEDDDDDLGYATEDSARVFVLECSQADEDDPLRAHFSLVYRGSEQCFLLQSLCVDAQYWLRVTRTSSRPCHAERFSKQVLEPWSIPKRCSTHIPHYRWQDSCLSWRVADEGRLATWSGQQTEDSVLCSASPLSFPASSSLSAQPVARYLTLQVVSSGPSDTSHGVSLSYHRPSTSFNCTGSLFLSVQGDVFMDGQQRLMKLPALTTGSSVTFTLEPRSSCLRTTIDTRDKQVTYDWPYSCENSDVWFAAHLLGEGWAIRCR